MSDVKLPMNLTQILNMANQMENKLTNLSTNDVQIGSAFSETQIETAGKFSDTLADQRDQANSQKNVALGFTILSGVAAGLSGMGGVAGMTVSANSLGESAQTVQSIGRMVVDPLAKVGSGISKAVFAEEQGVNTKAQIEDSNEMQTAGGIAKDSVDLASTLMDARVKVAGDMRGLIQDTNNASNY